MSQPPSPVNQITAQNSHGWVQHVPDGAMSVAVEDSTLVLKASNALQERFETLWQCLRSVGGLCASERSFVVNTVTLTKNRGPRLNILIFFGSCDLPL